MHEKQQKHSNRNGFVKSNFKPEVKKEISKGLNIDYEFREIESDISSDSCGIYGYTEYGMNLKDGQKIYVKDDKRNLIIDQINNKKYKISLTEKIIKDQLYFEKLKVVLDNVILFVTSDTDSNGSCYKRAINLKDVIRYRDGKIVLV